MSDGSGAIETTGITVYWRPGCPYCSRLRRDLLHVGLPFAEVDIWADPAGAELVRFAAGGNETVPTVVVGSVTMVNPSVGDVVEALRRSDPTLIVDDKIMGRLRKLKATRLAKWSSLGAVIAASITADATGHPALSWSLDAIAIVLWAVFRALKR